MLETITETLAIAYLDPVIIRARTLARQWISRPGLSGLLQFYRVQKTSATVYDIIYIKCTALKNYKVELLSKRQVIGASLLQWGSRLIRLDPSVNSGYFNKPVVFSRARVNFNEGKVVCEVISVRMVLLNW